jgi:hypothetical protein
MHLALPLRTAGPLQRFTKSFKYVFSNNFTLYLIEVDDSHVAGRQVELVTMYQILFMDDGNTEFNQEIGSSRKRSRSQSSVSCPSLEEHDDVVSPESATEEFTNVELCAFISLISSSMVH